MIEIKNLTKIYHNLHEDFVGLKNVTLTLPDNGLVFVAGESGNGKSTLLNILSGLDSYTKGQVLINGVDLNSMTDDEMFAYRANYSSFMFEDNNLIEDLSVLDNIKLGVELNGKTISEEGVDGLLKALKILDKKYSKPNELSCGQRQRVCMARALIKEPKVFFVDEPSGHLDDENAQLIWDVLKELSDRVLVVAVSHSKEIIKKYGDRVITLKDGKVLSDSKPIERTRIKSRDIHPITFDRSGRVGNKNLLKLSFGNIKSRAFRSIMCILLSVVSLLMFSTFYILQSYNGYKVQANFAKEKKMQYVNFNNNSTISVADYEIVNEVVGDYSFYSSVDEDWDVGFAYVHPSQANVSGIIFTGNYVKDGKNVFGQKLLWGNYPGDSKASGVVLSDYLADFITTQKYAIKYRNDLGEYGTKVLEKYSDFENKQILIGSVYAEVVGVYETNYKNYVDSSFHVKKNADITDYEYYYENVYTKIHVGSEFKTAYKQGVSKVDNVDVLINTERFDDLTFTTSYADITINTSNDLNISYELFNQIFAKEITFYNLSGLTENNLDTFNSYKFSKIVKLAINDGIAREYNIVGVNNSEDTIIVSTTALIGGAKSGELVGYEGIVSETALATTDLIVPTANVDDLADTIKELTTIGYNYNSLRSGEIDRFTDKIEVFTTAFLAVAIITAVFSVALMYTFISNIIKDRRKDNGLLLSMGATKWDIMKIFLMTTIMVAGISFILASAFTGVMSVLLNSKAVTGLAFNIFNINGLSIVYLFLMSVIVSALAVAVPMIQFSKRKPIQIIKDSRIK